MSDAPKLKEPSLGKADSRHRVSAQPTGWRRVGAGLLPFPATAQPTYEALVGSPIRRNSLALDGPGAGRGALGDGASVKLICRRRGLRLSPGLCSRRTLLSGCGRSRYWLQTQAATQPHRGSNLRQSRGKPRHRQCPLHQSTRRAGRSAGASRALPTTCLCG